MRLVVHYQTRRDLDTDTDTLPCWDIGLAEAGLTALGELLSLARRAASRRPRETGGILSPSRHSGGDLQFLDQRVAKPWPVPVELVKERIAPVTS